MKIRFQVCGTTKSYLSTKKRTCNSNSNWWFRYYTMLLRVNASSLKNKLHDSYITIDRLLRRKRVDSRWACQECILGVLVFVVSDPKTGTSMWWMWRMIFCDCLLGKTLTNSCWNICGDGWNLRCGLPQCTWELSRGNWQTWQKLTQRRRWSLFWPFLGFLKHSICYLFVSFLWYHGFSNVLTFFSCLWAWLLWRWSCSSFCHSKILFYTPCSSIQYSCYLLPPTSMLVCSFYASGDCFS